MTDDRVQTIVKTVSCPWSVVRSRGTARWEVGRHKLLARKEVKREMREREEIHGKR
jgi:hypothetical protein